MAAFRGQGQPRRCSFRQSRGIDPAPSFDRGDQLSTPAPAGGTTTIEFDEGTGAWVGGRTSLSGTVRNCAGGATPWGTWLTCEESLVEPAPEATYRREHGYVFEVAAPREAEL